MLDFELNSQTLNFSNLTCLYSTFHLEYPSVLSRFGPNIYTLQKKCNFIGVQLEITSP